MRSKDIDCSFNSSYVRADKNDLVEFEMIDQSLLIVSLPGPIFSQARIHISFIA
jgi:hypothetical protein